MRCEPPGGGAEPARSAFRQAYVGSIAGDSMISPAHRHDFGRQGQNSGNRDRDSDHFRPTGRTYSISGPRRDLKTRLSLHSRLGIGTGVGQKEYHNLFVGN